MCCGYLYAVYLLTRDGHDDDGQGEKNQRRRLIETERERERESREARKWTLEVSARGEGQC